MSIWAWLKNRHECLRRQQIVTNDENHVVVDESTEFPLAEEVYSQPWGGILFVYSFGDCCQLPPVQIKAFYDELDGKPNSSDNYGRLVFSEFINADHLDTSDSVIVQMNLVLRQDNPSFLKTLHNILRNGSMDNNDVTFILSRCYDKFSPEEKSSFDNNIHLVLFEI